MKFALLLIPVLIASACVQSTGTGLDTRNAFSVMPAAADIPVWTITESTPVEITAAGFETGYKIRLSRAQGYARITGRVIIYTFDEPANAGVYFAAENVTDAVDIGRENCATTQRLESGLEVTTSLCLTGNIVYQIDVTGVKYNETETDASLLAQAVEKKISAQSA